MRRSGSRSAPSISNISIWPDAIERLIHFTWNYFLKYSEFLALLNTENLAKARHLKRSTKVKSMHSPFVEMIRTVVRRGVASGDFVVAVDPVQLLYFDRRIVFFLSVEQRHLERDFLGPTLGARRRGTSASITWSRWCWRR